MRKPIKYLALGAISALTLGVVALSVNQTETASANTQNVIVADGASIRYKSSNDNTGDGIRFKFSISSAQFGEGKTFTENFSNVTESGIIILPTDMVTGELTKDTQYAEISKTIDVDATEELDNSWKATSSGYEATAYLWDIYPLSYGRDISARAYAVLDTGTVVYSDTVERSIRWVASAAYDDTETTSTQKQNLQDYLDYNVTFVDDYNDTETKSTVLYRDTATKPETDPVGTNGYHFLGWYNGETKYDFSSEITDDVTLTAKWLDARNVNFAELGTDFPKTLITAEWSNGTTNATVKYDESAEALYVKAGKYDPTIINLGVQPTGFAKVTVQLRYNCEVSAGINLELYDDAEKAKAEALTGAYSDRIRGTWIASTYINQEKTFSFINATNNNFNEANGYLANNTSTNKPLYLKLWMDNEGKQAEYYIKSIKVEEGASLDDTGTAKYTFTTNDDLGCAISLSGAASTIENNALKTTVSESSQRYGLLVSFNSIEMQQGDVIKLDWDYTGSGGIFLMYLDADGTISRAWVNLTEWSNGQFSVWKSDAGKKLIGLVFDTAVSAATTYNITSIEYISASAQA